MKQKSSKQEQNGKEVKRNSGYTHPPGTMSVLAHHTIHSVYTLSHNYSL